MPIAFRGNITAGEVALFDEPNQTGSVFDIDAARNAPLKTPAENLDKVYFHSSLDSLEVESDTTVTISHLAVSGGSSGQISGGGGAAGGTASTGAAVNFEWGKGATTHELVTHDLGYIPDCLVIVGDLALAPGMPVQVSGTDGRMRYVTPYVTTTQVRIYEWSSVSGSALPAISLDYRVLVFRAPPSVSGKDLFRFTASTGIVTMARNRFDSSRRYLQVVPGGTQFGIAYGKTIDLANGAPRFVDPDGDIFEPVADTVKYRTSVGHWLGTYSGSFGAAMNYTGDYEGPEAILVQAP